MKYFLIVILLPVLLITACNNNPSKPAVLTAGNVKSTFITLLSDSAYTLKTPGGAIIKIAKNSFAVASNTKLQLEIKEAYTLQDILLAGLSTESNGKLLKSAGMIYINATSNDKAVELLQPIKVSIPTDVYDDKMQLFKGEVKADSPINWIDPQPLDTGATVEKLLRGKLLYKQNCASCHKPAQDFTGPALAKCRERAPDKDWPFRFTRSPYKMIATDRYAKKLYTKWKGSGLMTSFALLSKEDINAILDYCDNEAELNASNISDPLPAAIATDTTASLLTPPVKIPCGFDTIYYAKPDTNITVTATELPDTVSPEIYNNNLQKAEDTEGFRNGFTDPNPTMGMYDFKIKTFGWYNVDAFVEGYAGSTYVSVNVQLQMEVVSEMHVYLFCPDKKMLSVSNKHEGNNYSFNKVEDKAPLFLNDKAVILAFGSKGDKILYGTASFTIQAAQNINISVKETTEAELKSFIQKNKINGIEIDLNKKDDFKIEEKPCDEIYADSNRTVKK